MTCKRVPKAHLFSVISLLITTLTVLVALGALAQVTAMSQPYTAAVVSTRQNASPSPSSTPLFLPAVVYGSGDNEASSVAVADVDGDGKPDLVVVNGCGSGVTCSMEGSVGVLLGNGDGTFHPAVTYGSSGWNATSVAVADVNADGKLDILVANECTTRDVSCPGKASVAVLLGNGNGTFQPAVTYGSGGWNANSVAVAEVNGDGKPDILVANGCTSAVDCSNNGAVAVLLGNGNGTFQAAALYSSGGAGATSVTVADVNGDGRSDLLVANCGCHNGTFFNTGSVGVLLGNGDGSFQTVVNYSSGGPYPWSVAVADVNGDGESDLMVANSCWCGVNGTVAVLLGAGDGTFQPAGTYDSGGNLPLSIAVSDVNGDGVPDLVVADRCRNSDCNTNAVVGVLLDKRDGTFEPVVIFDAGGNFTNSVAVADVNGDHRPDLLTAINGGVGVLLNNPQADTTPPVITLSATPKVLWPPNGRMVPVTVSGTITDTGSGVNVDSAVYSVIDEYGKVQPAGAITLGAGGSYSFTVLLQAARLRNDLNGRHYAITVRASDNAGNSGSQTSVVIVPHRRGH